MIARSESGGAYLAFKRCMDLFIAAVGLIVMTPIMLAVAIAVRWTMGKPVLFRQIRTGYREKPFVCFKFRTMRDVHDTHGHKLPDRERLTCLGLSLRRTSLDELPQLWNVLRGELSIIGPRPLYPEYLPYYTEEERLRHTVKPGITGWAQVHGRNYISFDERLALDVWYVRHISALVDLQILVRTAYIVLLQKDVADDPYAPYGPLHEQRAHTPELDADGKC